MMGKSPLEMAVVHSRPMVILLHERQRWPPSQHCCWQDGPDLWQRQARERNQLHRVYSVEVKCYRSVWLRLLDRIGNTRPDMLTGLRRTEP